GMSGVIDVSFFFFQAEDGIRDKLVTGVQTCALPICITHIPTGIVVQCQNERSQLKNKSGAMKVLKARLYELETKKKEAAMEAFVGEKKEIGFGSQIRSYVFQPYQMVKDHRTNIEVGNVEKVMDGGLDEFIEAYLKQQIASSKQLLATSYD